MTSLIPIAVGVGLQDGLNPCIFMTCAVFMVLGFWSTARSLPVFWFRLIFVLIYLLGVVAFNYSPLQIFIFKKALIITAKILYFVLGAGAFVLGIFFLRDWYLLTRGLPAGFLTDQKIKPFKRAGLLVFVLTIILAVLLSAMSTLWPINIYLMLLGNEAIIRGEWRMVASLVATYFFFNIWALWFIWAFSSIKNLRPTTSRVIFASIFFTASTTMIFIFK